MPVVVPSQYQATIQSAASQYGIPADLLAGVIASESNFNPSGTNCSRSGACGIAQFIPGTAQKYGVNVNDPTSGIYGAAHYLSDNYAKYGSYTKSIGQYLSGNPNYVPPSSSSYQKTGTYPLAAQYDAGLGGSTGSGTGTLTYGVTDPYGGSTVAAVETGESPPGTASIPPCPAVGFDWLLGKCTLGGGTSGVAPVMPGGTENTNQAMQPGTTGTPASAAQAGGIGNSISALSDSATSFFKLLSDPATWQRTALVILGIVILLAALILFGFAAVHHVEQ